MKKINITGINETIYFFTSKKGLPVYVWEYKKAHSFNLTLNVKYGSIDTSFKVGNTHYEMPNGIAHFMEHVKFNIDDKRTANDLFDSLGSDINAFTTFKYTSYTVYSSAYFKENLSNLLKYVYNPYFTDKLISKERGIIESEIRMGKDEQYNNLHFAFYKCLFENDKHRSEITGEIKDIKGIKASDIKLIYDYFYRPENMFLVVTGSVNPKEVMKIVDDTLENISFDNVSKVTRKIIKEPANVVTKEKIIKANVSVPKGKIGLKIPREVFSKYDDIKLNTLLTIILNCNYGDTSDLKSVLLENNILSFLAANSFVMDDYVIIDLTFESTSIDEATKILTSSLETLSINETDLKRKINSQIANLVTTFDDVGWVNQKIQNNLINYGFIATNLKEIYESITINDINDIIKKINTKEMVTIKMI